LIKFAVGYQLPEGEEEPLVDIVRFYRDHIAEVYFSWLDQSSGRSSLINRRGMVNWSGQERMEHDLAAIRQMGIKLDLLFNANCYGGKALSTYLANSVCSTIDHIGQVAGGLEIVTTTSPAVAHTVKEHFPGIEVRASVNMRIGTVKGMQYLSELYDSFYVQREFNRDLDYIRELLEWTRANNKGLYMLANSGCLVHCSAQTFHDNLVAHEQEICETVNVENWTPYACWNYYKDKANWASFLQNTWVRPEDLDQYDGLFPVIKLATRMHARPGMVIGAYVRRKHYGNLLDLFEPGFGPAFAPWVIDNTKFPDDWFGVTSTCDRRCHKCGYCQQVLDQVLRNMDEL
jgi:collagenase-like PrtC family protease